MKTLFRIIALASLSIASAFGQNQLVNILTVQGNITTPAGTSLLLGTGTAGTALTLATGGSLSLAAKGTNQPVTFAPSGTSFVFDQQASVVNAMGASPVAPTYGALWLGQTNTASINNANFAVGANTTSVGLNAPSSTSIVQFLHGSTEIARFAGTTGDLLLAGLTTDGTGVLQLPTGTTSAGGITLGNVNFYQNGSGSSTLTGNLNVTGTTLNAGTSGGAGVIIGSSGGSGILTVTDGSGNSNFQVTAVAGKVTRYGNVPTAGWGVGAIYAAAEITAQSAAATITTYTVGSADGSFEVAAQVDVTAVTALSTTITCTYFDKSNTSRTMIMPVQQLTGSFIAGGLITGTGAWETPVMHIRCKASTTITIATAAGTFTGVTYSADATITQKN